jgi:hypothetical protein
MMDDSLPNPLRPLSLPFGIRAAVAAVLALWLLLGSAPEMAAGFAGTSMLALAASLVLLATAIFDGVRAFRTGVRLPQRSIGIGPLCCAGEEVRDLMLAGQNPNDKYLSWIGRWAIRISDRFSGLPVLYQRLAEVAITALAFVIAAASVFVLVLAFGRASGKSEVSAAVLAWLWNGFMVLAYAFWSAMLVNFFTAARWGRKLSVNRIVKMIGGIIVLFAALSFTVQTTAAHVVAPQFHVVEGAILIAGSLGIVSALIVLALLRSNGMPVRLQRSRIQLSDTVSVHPQSVPGALSSVLAQSKNGVYRQLGDSHVNLREQANTAAGMFDALFAGEYGAQYTQMGPSPALRRFATFVGICGIALSALAYVLFWLAARNASAHLWIISGAVLLFGELAMLVAYYPLSEVLCSSYLIGFQIEGNYQKSGAGAGSILTDYILDGGLARATSVCFVPAALAYFETTRVLVCVTEDVSEEQAVMSAVRKHLARAAAPR